MMDYVLIGVGSLLCLGGIIGCFVPVLPGPGLCYLALLSLQFREEPPFGLWFLLVWAGVSIVATAFDYLLPPLATRKFGGSKKGVWGSVLGLIAGTLLFPPFGILIGPIAGAVAGELLDGKSVRPALKAAVGTLAGFMIGTAVKLAACLIMAYHFIANIN